MNDEDTIKIEEYMTPEAALDQLRSEKKDPSSTGGFFYALLKESSPEVVDHMEKKAADLIAAGHNIGRSFAAANDDPEKKEIFMTELQKIAIKISKSMNEIKEEEEQP